MTRLNKMSPNSLLRIKPVGTLAPGFNFPIYWLFVLFLPIVGGAHKAEIHEKVSLI